VQDSAIVPDPAHRLPGRGAYLHRDPKCYEAAVRRKALTRAMRLPTALRSNDVLDYLNQAEIRTSEQVVAELHPNTTTKADPS
jgi:predicted RNA-binding protein YlxR (DUF448 family)